MRIEPRWTVVATLGDGSRVRPGWRFWTRRGAAKWAQLATHSAQGLRVYQPARLPR